MDKPFKTIDEQIEILKSRGVSAGAEASVTLRREGYYSIINGYKDVFIDDAATSAARDDRYVNGTSFDDIYALFCFDRALRMTMMKYFAMAEASLKTACAYNFSKGHQDDGGAYLLRSSYRADQSYDRRVYDLIDEFKKIIHVSPYKRGKFKRDYIRHYAMNHDNVPIWVLTNFMMLGQVFKFFEYLPESMQNAIARTFSEVNAETHYTAKRFGPKSLRLSYDHIKDFRNICAHDERLFCARVSPSMDVTLVRVMGEMDAILPASESLRMRSEVASLVNDAMGDMGSRVGDEIMSLMGASSIKDIVIPTTH